LSVLFFVFLTLPAVAERSHYANPFYLIDNWEGGDQLSENSASALAQTPDGYLWIGTYSGLVRFNGDRFTRIESLPGVPHLGEIIYRLFVDRGGRLWVATESELIVREGDVWRTVADLKHDNLVVRSLASKADGQVWLGTLDGKMFAAESNGLRAVQPPKPFLNSGVFCCEDAVDGSLWLANRSYLGHLTDKGWQSIGPETADRKALIAAPARNGGLWVYSLLKHDLTHFHADGTSEIFPAPALAEIRELYEDREGHVWIASALNGLVRITPGSTNANLAINITNGLMNNVVLTIHQDAEDNLWVGTGSGGLHRMVKRRFTSVGLDDGLPNPILRTVIEESPGNLIVGTHGSGYARIHDGQVISTHRASNELSVASSYVWSLLRDHAGRLWIGTFNGGLLYEADGKIQMFTNWPESLGRTVNFLAEDKQQRIWAGTHQGLAIIENGVARLWMPDTNNPPNLGDAVCFAADERTGGFWVGTYLHGIFEIRDGQVKKNYGIAEGVPLRHISMLQFDRDGNLWAGVYSHGLVCIRDGQVIPLNRTNGLPADTIGSMVDDGRGYYWFGSDYGVLRLSYGDLREVIQSPASKANFQTFDLNDGLASLRCSESYQPAGLRDSNGHLWFATLRGLAGIDPATLALNVRPPPVLIESVSYDDRHGKKHFLNHPDATVFQFPPGASELRVNYAALSFAAPPKVRFDCRMENPRFNWAETNRVRYQIFHILQPGAHRFSVRAANNDGIWSDNVAFNFYVQPFYWQTTWFWALLLAFLAAAIALTTWRFAQARLHRQIEQLNLQRERLRLATVMEATSDLVVFADAARSILNLNPAGRRLLGHHDAGLPPNAKLHDLCTPGEIGQIENAAIPAAEKNGTWEGDIQLRHRNGQVIPASAVFIVDRDAAGNIHFISIIARDISERRRAEEKQAKLEEQLRQSQKLEAVGQLSGGVAHDFNNLLAVISGNVSLLELDATLLPDQREAIGEIRLSAERAAALTRQLLTFSRRQTMRLHSLDLNGVVENMTKMFRRILGEDIGMSVQLSSHPVIVYADAGMLEQVLLNLVVNARDAMPRGGNLQIRIHQTSLDEKTAATMPDAHPGEFAVLEVRDSGTGIAPEILPHIFEPFFTTKDIGKGTGLGLATVHGIAQQHRGWVAAQSQPNVGATFQVYLPLVPADSAAVPAVPVVTPIFKGTETILLAEDEPALRKFIVRSLSRLGYKVIEAPDGVQAQALWEQHRREIRLLLTDMVMPEGVGGIELARRLRAQDPALKVIYMTGYNAEIAGTDSKLTEGLNFIPKPFDQNKLAQTVRAALDA
jgi:PAS domain S-box-containing protein